MPTSALHLKRKPVSFDPNPANDLARFKKRFGHLPSAQQHRVKNLIRRRALEIIERERELKFGQLLEHERRTRTGLWPSEKFARLNKAPISSKPVITPEEMRQLVRSIIARTGKKNRSAKGIYEHQARLVYAAVRFFTRNWLAHHPPVDPKTDKAVRVVIRQILRESKPKLSDTSSEDARNRIYHGLQNLKEPEPIARYFIQAYFQTLDQFMHKFEHHYIELTQKRGTKHSEG